MKNLFTLFVSFLAMVTFAQNASAPIKRLPESNNKKTFKVLGKYLTPHASHSNRRSGTSSTFSLDYASLDADLAWNNQTNGSGVTVSYMGDITDSQDDDPDQLILNTRLPKDSVGYTSFALQVYPQIIDNFVDIVGGFPSQGPPWNQYDLSKIQINVDTILIEVGHIKVNHVKSDTIVVSIYAFDSLGSIAFDTGVTAAPLWRQVTITDTALSQPGSDPGSFYPTFMVLAPNLSLPANRTFAVQVEYFGPAEDAFIMFSGWRNDCGNTACGANLPYAGLQFNQDLYFNSLAPVRFGTGTTGGAPYVIYPTQYLYNDCSDPRNDVKDACEETRLENLFIYPQITVNIPNFFAEILADSLSACPGATINLYGRGYGSSAYPLTYAFTTDHGTLNIVDDSTSQLTVSDSSSHVILRVTDNNNVTVYDTILVGSHGFKANINNGTNPVVINCGSTATLQVTLSPTQSGHKGYAWNNQKTTASINGIYPGSYTVTVTNSYGCTASDNVSVTYPGGVNNTVDFTNPATPYCIHHDLTFTNQSSSKGTGWTATWDMGDQQQKFSTDVTYSYTTPGSYHVSLLMDSAGCTFISPPPPAHNIVVAQVCVGIEDIAFDNAVSLVPNPSNGNVTITVNSVEKNVSIKVYNVLGAEVKNFISNDTNTFSKNFNFSDLSDGTYLVKIQSGDRISIKRLVIGK